MSTHKLEFKFTAEVTLPDLPLQGGTTFNVVITPVGGDGADGDGDLPAVAPGIKPEYVSEPGTPVIGATGDPIHVGDRVRSTDGLEWEVVWTYPYVQAPRADLMPLPGSTWHGNHEKGTQRRPKTLTVIECVGAE